MNPNYAYKIHGKKVILVDDVLTTGSTANECAKLLKKHGVARVSVITVARVDI
jgi:predicted amidophosphoribosyltransferase